MIKKVFFLFFVLFSLKTVAQSFWASSWVVPGAVSIPTQNPSTNNNFVGVNFSTPSYNYQNIQIANSSNLTQSGSYFNDGAILEVDNNYVPVNSYHFPGTMFNNIEVIHREGNYLYYVLLFNNDITVNNITYNSVNHQTYSLIIKMSTTGQFMWVKQVNHHLILPKIQIYNNDLFISGYYKNNGLTIDNTSVSGNLTGNNVSETFLAKFNATSGVLNWLKTSNTVSSATEKIGTELIDFQIDSQGNPVLIASLYCSSTKFENTTINKNSGCPNCPSIVIVKYSNSGSVLWAKSPSAYYIYGNDIKIDTNDNVYITSRVSSNNGYTVNYWGTSVKGRDGHLFKLDKNGNFQWAQGSKSDKGEHGFNGIYLKGSDVYVATQINNEVKYNNYILNSSGYKLNITRFDSFGNFVAFKNFELSSVSNINNIRFTDILNISSSNIFEVSGFFTADTMIDNHISIVNPNPQNSNNTFVLRSVNNALLSSEEIVVDKWKLFPNPAKDEIFVDGEELSLKYKIYDLSGRIVDENSLKNSKINISNLSNGIYIVELANDEFMQRVKIIKE